MKYKRVALGSKALGIWSYADSMMLGTLCCQLVLVLHRAKRPGQDIRVLTLSGNI